MLTDDRAVGSLERMLHLRKAPIIGTLPANDLAVVAEAARPRVFRAGDVLLREDERVASATFIVEGRVRLERGGQRIGVIESGSGLGGIGMLARSSAVWTAVAETDTLVLELDADSFLDLLEDHFEILRHFLRETCRQVIGYWRALPAGTPPLVKGLRTAEARSVKNLDLVERIFFLRQVTPFGSASINALAELARGFSEVQFQPGQRLWEEGDPARQVMLVVDGTARCEARDGFTLRAGPGVPLGALESVAGLPRWYDVVVTDPLTVLSGEIEMLFDVFEDNLDMALQFQSAMSRWALALAQQVTELAPRRLAELSGAAAAPVRPD